ADTSPGDMVGLSRELASEIRGAATAEVAPPDMEMRRAIVRRHADLLREASPAFEVTDTMVERMISTVPGHGRELCGVLFSLHTEAEFGDLAPSDDMLEKVIHRVVGEPREPSLEDIKRTCMAIYNLSKSDIESKSKVRTICYPRQMAMYLSRIMTGKSYPQIAKVYKKEDHTTVLHAFRKFEKLVAKGDSDALRQIENAKREVMKRVLSRPATN
ncbi:MAG: helix-turn-helix domain-containing protein, partial [Pseudomonadota bacterium]